MEEHSLQPRKFYLFNCDRTYNLDRVETLINAVTREKVAVEKTYFPLPRMAELCKELEGREMDCAVFVVHANESRLSLNEDRAGIGYAKVYRTLLRATNNRVLIVIGGDDNYKNEEERDTKVLSNWARRKVSSQFNEEYMNGSRSFIFSWDQKHHPIHEDALAFYLEPAKTEPFVPKPRPRPLPAPPQEPTNAKAEHRSPVTSSSVEASKDLDEMRQPTASSAKEQTIETQVSQRATDQQVQGIEGRIDIEKPISLQVFQRTKSPQHVETVYQFLSAVFSRLSIPTPPYAPSVDDDAIVSHLRRSRPDYVIIAADKLGLQDLQSDQTAKDFFQTIFQCINKWVGKKVLIIVCGDDTSADDTMTSQYVHGVIEGISKGLLDPDKLLVISWNNTPSQIHKDVMLDLLGNHGNQSTNQRDALLDPLRSEHRSSDGKHQDKDLTIRIPSTISHTPYPTSHSRGDNTGGQHWLHASGDKRPNRGQSYGQTATNPTNHGQQGSSSGQPEFNSRGDKLCYRAIVKYTWRRVWEYNVLHCDHGFQPPLYMMEDAQARYSRLPSFKFEIWVENGSGRIFPLVPVTNKLHQRLRYCAEVTYGRIANVKHSDPPGSRPPDYIVDSVTERHRGDPKAVLQVWQDENGTWSSEVSHGTDGSCVLA